jgi:hypothetical protein
MVQPRVISGATAIVRKNGKVVGYCTNITVTENYTLQRVDVLGSIDSYDIEPVGRTVSVQVGFMRVVPTGGSAAQGLVPSHIPTATNQQRTLDVVNFFAQGLDLELADSADFGAGQSVRYMIKGCKPESQSFTVNRQTLMATNVNFQALKLIELTDSEQLG